MQGLENAITELLPDAEHMYCARHVYMNWRKRGHRGEELKVIFWKIAKSPNVYLFEKNMRELYSKAPQGSVDIVRVAPRKWCRAFFDTDSVCDMVDNNMCEAFNGSLVEARSLPIISLFEKIRKNLMVRIKDKRIESAKWKDNLGPRIWKQIEKNYYVANESEVAYNGGDGYEIEYKGHKFVVNLENKTCSCRQYTISGIPCGHSICAIRDQEGFVQDYVSSWYEKDVYQNQGKVVGTTKTKIKGFCSRLCVRLKMCPAGMRTSPRSREKWLARPKPNYFNPTIASMRRFEGVKINEGARMTSDETGKSKSKRKSAAICSKESNSTVSTSQKKQMKGKKADEMK